VYEKRVSFDTDHMDTDRLWGKHTRSGAGRRSGFYGTGSGEGSGGTEKCSGRKKGSAFYMGAMLLLGISTFCTDDGRIILFNTPKLVQILYEEGFIRDECAIRAWLRAGTGGNISVLGTRVYDLRSNEISLGCQELAGLIVERGIHITF